MSEQPTNKNSKLIINEDWVSVLLAFFLIFLAVIGVIGETGIQVKF